MVVGRVMGVLTATGCSRTVAPMSISTTQSGSWTRTTWRRPKMPPAAGGSKRPATRPRLRKNMSIYPQAILLTIFVIIVKIGLIGVAEIRNGRR